MTSRDFCYWLQGHFEIGRPTTLNAVETDMIRRHLALVFKHEIDPSLDGGDLALRAERQAVHDGTQLLTGTFPTPAITPALPWLSPYNGDGLGNGRYLISC